MRAPPAGIFIIAAAVALLPKVLAGIPSNKYLCGEHSNVVDLANRETLDGAKADIVMWIDTSGSMKDEFTYLNDNLKAFWDWFTGKGMDVRITLVHQRVSGFGGPSDLPNWVCDNPSANRATCIPQPNFTYVPVLIQSWDGLQVMADNTNKWMKNLRTDATLSIVGITDDKEKSPHSTYQDQQNKFIKDINAAGAAKGVAQISTTVPNGFVYHSISCLSMKSGCHGIATTNHALADLTNGKKLDLTDTDWRLHFITIAQQVKRTIKIECEQPIIFPTSFNSDHVRPTAVRYKNKAGSTVLTATWDINSNNKCPAAPGNPLGSGPQRFSVSEPRDTPLNVYLCPDACHKLSQDGTMIFDFDLGPCFSWVPGDWAKCTCGMNKTRTYICVNDKTKVPAADESKCDPSKKPPDDTVSCGATDPRIPCFEWVPGDWRKCECDLSRSRPHICVDDRTKVKVDDSKCDPAKRPAAIKGACNATLPGPLLQDCVPDIIADPRPPDPTRPSRPLNQKFNGCVGGGDTVVISLGIAASWNLGAAKSGSGINPSPLHDPLAGLECVFGNDQGFRKNVSAIVFFDPTRLNTASVACETPRFPVPEEWDGPAAMTEWKSHIQIKFGQQFLGQVHDQKLDYTLRPCCAAPAPLLLWPIFILLPFALLCCCFAACATYMRSKAALPMPALQHVDQPPQPSMPDLVTEEREVTKIVQSPRQKKPEPVKKSKAKKKWDQVATATYLRDGAHMAVKWGEFGEAGNHHNNGDDHDDDGEDEESEDEEVVELHQELKVKVDLPAAHDKQIASLKVVSVFQGNGTQDSSTTSQKCPGCCSSKLACCPLIMAICCFLLLVGLGVLIYFLMAWYASLLAEEKPACLANNVTSFCESFDRCTGCKKAEQCEWCGGSCSAKPSFRVSSGHVGNSSVEQSPCQTAECQDGFFHMTPQFVPLSLLVLISVLSVLLTLIWCAWIHRRRKAGHATPSKTSKAAGTAAATLAAQGASASRHMQATHSTDNPMHKNKTTTVSNRNLQQRSMEIELGDWDQHTDPSSGTPYYHNRRSGVVSWLRPANAGGESKDDLRVDSRLHAAHSTAV